MYLVMQAKKKKNILIKKNKNSDWRKWWNDGGRLDIMAILEVGTLGKER